MIKHPDQRVGVFVDVANMYYSAKNLYSARVNFGNVLENAVAGRKLIRAIAYVVRADTPEEQTFFDALAKQGFEVKSKDLQVFVGGAKKGDWDVGMSVDMIKLAPSLDAITLVTGDGDFAPLCTYLQDTKGCLVQVMAFGESTSAKLRESADEFIDLSSDLGKYLLRPRSNPLRILSRGKPQPPTSP